MTKAPERAPVAMKTLRFSRIVKKEIGGRGLTLGLMMEARVPVDYPAAEAVLDLLEVDGRLKLDLKPAPDPVVVLDHESTIVEMAFPGTETEVYDYAAAVAAEMTQPAIEARAVEILMPGVVKPRSMKRQLLTAGVGSNRLIRPTEG